MMQEKIFENIVRGTAPVHLLSVQSSSQEFNLITKIRRSSKYSTNHLQVGKLYKSAI